MAYRYLISGSAEQKQIKRYVGLRRLYLKTKKERAAGVKGRVVPADTVHHIVELMEDYSKRCDLDNLISISEATHSMISKAYKAHNVEYDKKNKLLTRSMNDAILSEPNSFGEIKIDKMLQKVRIDPCDAIIDAHKLAMGVEVEEITTDQSIEAYLKMFEKAGVKED